MHRATAPPRFVVALFLGLACLASGEPMSGQSDLDALMAKVLARRDDNWKKLQQYVLEERETFQLTAPGDRPMFGFRREYLWFPRDGRFIKSPLSADGVPIGEAQRRREEALWVAREERRASRLKQGTEANTTRGEISIGAGGVNVEIEAAMRDSLEPGFVSAAYFLNFKFDQGQYALVGRETHEGRAVLRIEYYPTLLFKEGRTRPNRELRERDADVERKMNKVSLVTLWVDPAQSQIVRYEFRNIDTDFLPAQWLLRLDGLTAAMEMGQPFPDVWLPRSMRIGFDTTLAIGQVSGRYASEYHDYRLADVSIRVTP
jgi:hypothetical protein